jgi:hypothetical protein
LKRGELMTLRSLFVAVALGSALLGAALATLASRTTYAAQIATPDRVRFRVVGDEPISMPDGRSFANNWKVVVMRDTKSDQCYTLFMLGGSMSATGPATCPN